MSDEQTYGSLVLATDVEDGATLTLQRWLPMYLGRVSRQIGQASNFLTVPGSYTVANDPTHWPEDQPPTVVLASPGTIGQPKRSGRLYRAKWQLQVVVFVTAQDRPSTERLAKYYGGAVRSLLLQKADLGGIAAGVEWNGEKYDVRIADRDQGVLGSCSNTFCVDVRDVVQALGGPLTEGDPLVPPPDYPTATNVTVTRVPEAP